MVADSFLRRSLRKVPAYHLLNAKELDALIACMENREYRPGDVLWHGNTSHEHLGVLWSGEAVLEHRYRGRIVRSRKLGAGDVFEAPFPKEAGAGSLLTIRALTAGALYILPGSAERSQIRQAGGRGILLLQHKGIWAVLVFLTILALTWGDLSRILSGIFLLASDRAGSESVKAEASQLVEYASWVDSSAAFAYNQEGYLNLKAGNLTEAQADFLRALQVDSGNGPGLNNLAVTYFSLSQGVQAMETQRSAVTQNPDNAVVQYNLGEILLKNGEEQEALSAFRQAWLIAPEWALPHIHASCVYLRWLDFARAESEAREAVRLDPTQGAAHLTLAIALYHQGRLPESQTALAQALEIDPLQPVALFYQVLTLSALGETDTALSLLENLRSKEADPFVAARLQMEIEALQRVVQDREP